MLLITIPIEGKDVKIDFPEFPHEVTLSAFIDYEKSVAALNKWREENEGGDFNSFKYRAGELRHIIACISAFIGRDISKAPMNKFRFSAKHVDVEVETNLFTVFGLAAVCVSKYKETEYLGDYWFEYKGERYYIPFCYTNELTKQKRYGDVTTAQAVEALEAWRLFETVQAKDDDGGYWFKTVLNIIACMARTKADPEFPKSDSEIQRHISERILHFREIDMQAGLDVYNFFFGTLNPFDPIPIIPTSSNLQSVLEKRRSNANF